MYKYKKKMYFDRIFAKDKKKDHHNHERYALEEYKDMIQKLFGGTSMK